MLIPTAWSSGMIRANNQLMVWYTASEFSLLASGGSMQHVNAWQSCAGLV